MKFPDQSYNLRIELDTKNFECTPAQIEQMENALDPLRKLVKDFPQADLYITAYFHSPHNDYKVKTALALSGRTLFTGDRHELVLTAYDRCIRKLVNKVGAYKQGMSGDAEKAKIEKGTHQEVLPDDTPDFDELVKAVEEGDYARFRQASNVYEEPIRKRAGRWVQRYPEVDAMIGDGLAIADIVEEVFLNAFERFEDRNRDMRFGDWLDHLIDPSLKMLIEHPEEELENISMARSLRGAEREEGE